jgi:Na+-driven multidrug efflux pump
MASLLVPHLAEVSAKRPLSLRSAALLTIFSFGAIATLYSAAILVLGSDLLELLFHKPEVTAASRLLWPLAAYALLDAVNTAISIALVANAATRSIFWGRAASIAVLLPGALYLGTVNGLDGLAWASVIANAVCATILAPALAKLFRRSSQAPLRR